MLEERLVGGGEKEGRVPCLTEPAENKGVGGGEDIDVGGVRLDFGLEESEHGGGDFDAVWGVWTEVGFKDARGLCDEGGAPTGGELKDLDFEPEKEEVGLVVPAEEVEEVGHPSWVCFWGWEGGVVGWRGGVG